MANILIIKLGALGDVVMSTSLIKQIQSCHSTDNLFLLTAKPFDTIFHNWGNLNIHTIERKGLKNSLRTVAWIRQNHFDSVYDLQSNDRTGLYCALSGITRRVGNHPRYPYNIHPEDSYQGQCHIYSRMLAVLESANIPVKPCTPSLPASEEEQLRIRTWLKENKLIDNNFIIIHAGGSKQHPEKRWPFYKQLATKLFAMDKMIVFVGGDDDLETNKQLSSIAGINASSMFTFSELAELGRHSSFAIVNDSGPMHILSCSGIPVYGLFGPTNWRRNHAVGQEGCVISAQTDGEPLINNSPFRPVSLAAISTNIILNRLSSDGVL
jgi:ADP-heptose:LPS heptosyltransferase